MLFDVAHSFWDIENKTVYLIRVYVVGILQRMRNKPRSLRFSEIEPKIQPKPTIVTDLYYVGLVEGNCTNVYLPEVCAIHLI